MAVRNALLRLRSKSGWSVDLDSSTAAQQWQKAQAFGVNCRSVEWRLTTDTDEADVSVEVMDPDCMTNPGKELASVNLEAVARGWRWTSAALLFDNGSIHVEIQLPGGATNAAIFHISRAVCERFVTKTSVDCVRLMGLIEPGNDVGDFELSWQWRQGGVLKRAGLRTTILSTKMDLRYDFPRMVADIRKSFPTRLQLDLVRQTQWGLSSTSASSSLQSWLAVFQSLEMELRATFARLISRPRWKLDEEDDWRPLERIQRMSPCREEYFALAAVEKPHGLYRGRRSVVDVDRLENRFAKHVAISVLDGLRRVSKALRNAKTVSEVFLDWLEARLVQWENIASHPFWRAVGPFKGLQQTSLTLQRDTIYSRILRGSVLFRRGLEVVLSGGPQGGIRSIDDLYELWCLVQMDRALGDLGWTRDVSEWDLRRGAWDDLEQNGGRETGGARLSYSHQSHPGESVALLYRAVASSRPSTRSDWEGVFATPVDQHPDLVLRHRNQIGEIGTWVFDAKYRVEMASRGAVRIAPSDAINQVQRYRDALLVDKSSPVREAWGGYILFPGSITPAWLDHPQARAIKNVNIGAIPIRCAEPIDGYDELKDFIGHKLSILRSGGHDGATPGARGFKRR